MLYISETKYEPPLSENDRRLFQKQLKKWKNKLSAMQQCMAVSFYDHKTIFLKLTAMVSPQTGDNLECARLNISNEP